MFAELLRQGVAQMAQQLAGPQLQLLQQGHQSTQSSCAAVTPAQAHALSSQHDDFIFRVRKVHQLRCSLCGRSPLFNNRFVSVQQPSFNICCHCVNIPTAANYAPFKVISDPASPEAMAASMGQVDVCGPEYWLHPGPLVYGPWPGGQMNTTKMLPFNPHVTGPHAKIWTTLEHLGIPCALCGMEPILGWRYASVTTDGFNICGHCVETAQAAPHAPYLIVTNPIGLITPGAKGDLVWIQKLASDATGAKGLHPGPIQAVIDAAAGAAGGGPGPHSAAAAAGTSVGPPPAGSAAAAAAAGNLGRLFNPSDPFGGLDPTQQAIIKRHWDSFCAACQQGNTAVALSMRCSTCHSVMQGVAYAHKNRPFKFDCGACYAKYPARHLIDLSQYQLVTFTQPSASWAAQKGGPETIIADELDWELFLDLVQRRPQQVSHISLSCCGPCGTRFISGAWAHLDKLQRGGIWCSECIANGAAAAVVPGLSAGAGLAAGSSRLVKLWVEEVGDECAGAKVLEVCMLNGRRSFMSAGCCVSGVAPCSADTMGAAPGPQGTATAGAATAAGSSSYSPAGPQGAAGAATAAGCSSYSPVNAGGVSCSAPPGRVQLPYPQQQQPQQQGAGGAYSNSSSTTGTAIGAGSQQVGWLAGLSKLPTGGNPTASTPPAAAAGATANADLFDALTTVTPVGAAGSSPYSQPVSAPPDVYGTVGNAADMLFNMRGPFDPTAQVMATMGNAPTPFGYS